MFNDSELTQIISSWVVGLGDEYILSWPNTVLYGCSFVAAIYRWRSLERSSSPLREQRLWIFLIFVLLVLGINKQLNFHILLIDVGRRIVSHGGWFEERRLLQTWFAYGLSCAVGCTVLAVIVSMKELWRRNVLALAGLIVLCIFTVLRATSMNHIDSFDYLKSQGQLRVTDLIEFFGVLCIFINALKHPRKK